MGSILKRSKLVVILSGVALIGFGIALLVNSEGFSELVTRALGIVLLVLGALSMVGGFTHRSEAGRLGVPDIIIGIIEIVVGALLIAMPATFSGILAIIFGAFVALMGSGSILDAFSSRQVDFDRWWIALVIGIVTIALGVLVIAAPFFFELQAAVVVGVSLIVAGVGQLVCGILLPKVGASQK